MKEFMEILKKEQEPIQKALERVIATLPQSVQEIASYALLLGGKRLRPLLTILCARLMHATLYGENAQICSHNPRLYDAAIVLEMFHVASLLHDDVLDNADTRRGQASVHVKFGIRPCLLAGDALLASGNRLMAECNEARLMTSISNALLHTSTGEIEEIALVGKILPCMDDYLSVIEGKTAWILRSACEVGAIVACMPSVVTNVVGANVRTKPILDEKTLLEKQKALADFGLHLGMAFQIVDDALDFAPEEFTGKPQGGDLRERKCTPPILMYAESLGDVKTSAKRQDFEEKFACVPTPVFEMGVQNNNTNKKDFTEQEIQEIIQNIVEQKFPEKTKDLALNYLQKAENALASFSGVYKDVLLQTLQYVRERKK